MSVLPLSQGEVAEVREDFAEAIMNDPPSLVGRQVPTIGRDEDISRVVTGGFPPVMRRARSADRARWFDDYIDLVIERDVLELTRVRQRRQLPLLLRDPASQTGQVLNIAKAAATVGMEKSTAENDAKLLEAVFLVHQLPAWGTTLGSRVWRTHDGDEVDLVLEREDGKVAALEVKAASRVPASELRGLFKLRRRLASQFLGGVVLYTGARAYAHDGLQVVPIPRLWRGQTGVDYSLSARRSAA